MQSAAGPAPKTLVTDLVIDPGHPQLCPRVGDAEAGPGEQYNREAGRFQRSEHQPMTAGAVGRVQPDVGLREGAEVGDRKHSPQPGTPHHERHQRDVGPPVREDVRAGPGRVQMRNAVGVHRPVDEGEVTPELIEHGRTRQPRCSDRITGGYRKRVGRIWRAGHVAHRGTRRVGRRG